MPQLAKNENKLPPVFLGYFSRNFKFKEKVYAMSSAMYESMRVNPKFQELVEKRGRFAWTLATIVLVLFYAIPGSSINSLDAIPKKLRPASICSEFATMAGGPVHSSWFSLVFIALITGTR